MKQINFGFIKNYKNEFGGSLLKKGQRKIRRPLSTKHPIHLIIKSSVRFRLFNPRNQQIEALLRKEARRFQIQLFDFAINWSHIHMVVRLPSRESYVAFIRSYNSQLVTLLSRNMFYGLKGLFEFRPYTKILTWGRQFHVTLNYQKLNQQEAAGLIVRKTKAHTELRVD